MMTVIPHSVTHMYNKQQTYNQNNQCSEHWFFFKQVTTSKKNLTPQFAKTDEKCKMITCA